MPPSMRWGDKIAEVSLYVVREHVNKNVCCYSYYNLIFTHWLGRLGDI